MASTTSVKPSCLCGECHKCKRRAYMKAWYHQNGDRVRAMRRERPKTEAQRVAGRAAYARWLERNRELAKTRARESMRRRRAADPTLVAREKRKYRAMHPDRVKAERFAYRERHRNAPGRTTTQIVLGRIQMYGGCCYLCGSTADEIDHVIPLSRGGSNWAANLRPICRTCNRRKGAKRLREMYA